MITATDITDQLKTLNQEVQSNSEHIAQIEETFSQKIDDIEKRLDAQESLTSMSDLDPNSVCMKLFFDNGKYTKISDNLKVDWDPRLNP